jgi:hypothetical protein
VKRYLTSVIFVWSLHLSPCAFAEIAVRHPTTSENEFQAMAQALGYTTVAEILSSKNARSAEVLELFRQRLIEAQREWLSRSPDETTGAAVEQFLDLALEADWSENERQEFITFFLRKLESDPNAESESFARLHSFLGDEESLEKSAMSTNLLKRWSLFKSGTALIASSSKTNLPAISKLPTDVVGIIVNGRFRLRENSPAFSTTPTRVTMISNSYQPFTIRLKGRETVWPQMSRRPWINEDCTINPLQGMQPAQTLLPTPAAHGALGEIKMRAVGFLGCEKTTNQISAGTRESKDESLKAQTELAKFGLSGSPSNYPMAPTSIVPAVIKKPWFWGALGVVALGAVLAVKANDNRSKAVQSTNNDGW